MADMISNTYVGSVDLKDNARAHVGNVVHIHKTEDRCLSDMRITDPRLDKARIEATKGGLFEDSYRWILEHSDFRQWRDDEQSRLLWIKGDPGKGKTMLLCDIVNELTPQTRLKDKEANILLSYFFCQAADERINSATAVLRGLIFLIVEQQPPLVSHIQKQHKHGGDTIFNDVNAWFALSEIFLNILEDASLEQTYVIIDALDECVTDLPKLLDFITTKSALFPRVKWIVSSRNWPDIEERLDSASQQMKLCLELNEKSISAAVDAYIEHQVNQLAQIKKYDVKTKDALHRHLSSNSKDTFLWVALVCQNLEKMSLQNTLIKLNEFPPGLDALYERMMEQIHQLSDVNDTVLCCRILSTVLLVYRPVTLAELGSIIESPKDDLSDAKSMHKAVGLCGSFLTMRDSQVYVIHQSAKDYLSDKAVSATFLASPADVHGDIFSLSIQAMSVTLRRNIYNSDSPGLPSNKIKVLEPDPLGAIRYSCIHWIDYFCDMHSGNSEYQNQVDDEKSQTTFLFLRKHFLHWLEALGHMGHIEDGVLSMARLEDLLRGKSTANKIRELTQDQRWFHPFSLRLKNLFGMKPPDHELLNFVQDSWRFIRQNSSLIAYLPLQIYMSALIFSPMNSLIRKTFENEEPQWLKVKPIVEDNWWPCFGTFRDHSDIVCSVAFSPDGRYLASGSSDKTIKIWNAVTGKTRQTLKGHGDTVCSVAFSPDGRYLASGSSDMTITIWDAATGEERQTLKGHTYWVRSVAFSPDGRYLASGSSDKTIKIWDAITGEERQTLKGHTYGILSVAFSPDGRYLASGSSDMTITIWDAITGEERQTLKGHTNWVLSIAFSPDGRYLVSGSRDKTIKIWDITGKERQTLHSHSSTVRSVAFSPNGRHFTSASSDKTIKIWDITGKEQQTFRGHSNTVLSVAFSPDGRYFTSGSSDKTIKIWDITGKEQQNFRCLDDIIVSTIFSADGSYLATMSFERTAEIWDTITIKIWDTTTGNELHILKGNDGKNILDAFSEDNRYFVSVSSSKTIKIWDMVTGKELRTLTVNATIHTIPFDDTVSYLHTDIGPIKLGTKHRPAAQSTMIPRILSPDSDLVQDQEQRQQIIHNTEERKKIGYRLSNNRWITWNEHNILWLPSEYIPFKTAVWPDVPPATSPKGSSTDVIMALCYYSGRVVIMRMSRSGPYSPQL